MVEYTKISKVENEMIDGMQRLNALTAFVEQDYATRGGYLDRDVIVENYKFDDKADVDEGCYGESTLTVSM